MDESKNSSNEGLGPKGMGGSPFQGKTVKAKSQKVKSESEEQEVLFNLPGGLKYKLPGKRQRVAIGSLVVGLNALLLIAVALYFYSPGFQQFIYNVGRG